MAQEILVVEDEPAIVDNIVYALETEGYDVVSSSTGQDALALLEEKPISLIVLDVGLPDMSGFDLCKRLRRTSDIPIIFLTARDAEVDRVVGLEIGGDDYVVKPFSPRELAARVKAVLRRRPSGAGDNQPTSSSPFSLDPERMTIAYFGSPLDLSRYEFRMLETLLKRPGWVFSREKLMDLVWDEPEASLDRTVDTHIKTLRAKLRAVKRELDPIRTHRGLGYSLRESL
jgi:two-component system catabolic regulation response regulator CreB